MNVSASDRPLAQVKHWVEADGVHIDVCGLLPAPLVAILELVGSIRDTTLVIVRLRPPR